MIFSIDSQIKERAMKKAQADGVPFSMILKLAAKAYAENKLNIILGHDLAFNQNTKQEIEQATQDIKRNKNLSPAFKDAKKALTYLKR